MGSARKWAGLFRLVYGLLLLGLFAPAALALGSESPLLDSGWWALGLGLIGAALTAAVGYGSVKRRLDEHDRRLDDHDQEIERQGLAAQQEFGEIRRELRDLQKQIGEIPQKTAGLIGNLSRLKD